MPSSVLAQEGERPSGTLQMLIRRRWFFLGPFFAAGFLAYGVAHVLPLQYRSSSFIIIEHQKIPEQYVMPNILMTLQRRLDSMTQQVLSRTRLQRFIDDFGLYASERQSLPIDEVIDRMRKRASVEVVQPTGRKDDLTGFRIYFSDPNPQVAQRITDELTSLFIEQDIRERTTQSQQTTAFLESQLERAGKELDVYERRLRQYKLSHLGELPDQLSSNLSILASLEVQLQAKTSALDRADEQRIYFEAMRAQVESLRSFRSGVLQESETASQFGRSSPLANEPTDGPPSANASLEFAQVEVATLWKELAELTAKFTNKHPEVMRVKKEIADWESMVDRLGRESAAAAELDSRLKAAEAEIESKRREARELDGRIGELQSRINQVPVREQELAELVRLHENAKTHVQALLQKKQGSELASNLEERQGGEQFRLLDPATLPTKPEGRSKIIVAGWFLAAGAGAALIFLREMFDQTVHKPPDLERHPSVLVLARIPTIRSAGEEHVRRFRRKLEAMAIAAMLLICLGSGAEAYLQR